MQKNNLNSNSFVLKSRTWTCVKGNMSQIKIDGTWKEKLMDEFTKPYMVKLKAFLKSEYDKKKKIFPPGPEYFAALNLTSFEDVRVVVIGQDPYHGPGQAEGLSFSVKPGVRFPPSLQNILKELQSDLQLPMPKSGSLVPWARHGVLLLNSVLTVEAGNANSHQGKGWEQFTDRIVSILNEEKRNLVFILWGSYAQKKAAFVDTRKHYVIKEVHPSPLSAHRGFLGSKPFSKANAYLKKHGLEPIDWTLR